MLPIRDSHRVTQRKRTRTPLTHESFVSEPCVVSALLSRVAPIRPMEFSPSLAGNRVVSVESIDRSAMSGATLERSRRWLA